MNEIGGGIRPAVQMPFIGNTITDAPHDVLCAVAGQWYVIDATFIATGARFFTITSGGLITYTGDVATDILVVGSLTVFVDRSCTVTIGSKFNGINQPGGLPKTFLAQAPTGTYVQPGVPKFNPGDNIQAIVKSDTTNTRVTFETIFGAFYGVY